MAAQLGQDFRAKDGEDGTQIGPATSEREQQQDGRLAEDFLTEDDSLFVTSRRSSKHGGKCWGLSADALANVMGRVMKEAGIPPEFRPTLLYRARRGLRRVNTL